MRRGHKRENGREVESIGEGCMESSRGDGWMGGGKVDFGGGGKVDFGGGVSRLLMGISDSGGVKRF